MENLNQKEIEELLSGNVGKCNFFLTNLSQAHEMFVKHNYESSHIRDNIKDFVYCGKNPQ